jgi:hypothetical protein
VSTYSLANAFLQVRDDVESLQRAVNLALHKSTYSVGYSKILTSLSSSLLQALLEGSLTLKCNENQVLMQQVLSPYNAPGLSLHNVYPGAFWMPEISIGAS